MAFLSTTAFPKSVRFPTRLQDEDHVRMLFAEVFSNPDVVDQDSYGPEFNQARLLGDLFEAVLASTQAIEALLDAASSARANAFDAAATGRNDPDDFMPPMLQVTVDEYRWAHLIRMLPLIERGMPIVHKNFNVANEVMFSDLVLRQKHLGAVLRLMSWEEAKSMNGEPLQPSVVAMSAALMDAFLKAGFLESDSPGVTALAVNDQPSALQVAIHCGNQGITQSLLDFGVDLRRLPTKVVDFVEARRPRLRVQPGDVAGYLDACAVHQPHTVALVTAALMRAQIKESSLGAGACTGEVVDPQRAMRVSRRAL